MSKILLPKNETGTPRRWENVTIEDEGLTSASELWRLYPEHLNRLSERVKEIDDDSEEIKENIKQFKNESEEIKKELKKEADNIKLDFDNFKGAQEKVSSFMKWMAGIIVGTFFVTGFLIALDYFKYNEERYEKFIDKTEKIKNSFYSKQETDNFFDNYLEKIDESNKNLNNLKDCLKNGGWSKCF